MSSQFMEHVRTFVEERQVKLPNTINSMMNFSLIHADEVKGELELAFPVSKWQINPMHTMHGGMICTAFDISMGCLSYALNGGNPNPTIDMNVHFVCGIPEGETLFIKVTSMYAGSRIVQLEAHAYLSNQVTLAAQASGSYIVNHKKVK